MSDETALDDQKVITASQLFADIIESNVRAAARTNEILLHNEERNTLRMAGAVVALWEAIDRVNPIDRKLLRMQQFHCGAYDDAKILVAGKDKLGDADVW